MILVSGATGTTGGQVARHLKEKGADFRALVRSEDKAGALRERGIDSVIGDYGSPDALKAAFDGVDHAFLVAPASEQQVEQEAAFIDAAKEAGVAHVVKLSVVGADLESPVRFAAIHAHVEKHLKDSGLGYTIVQPNSFMDNTLGLAGSIAEQGVVYSSIGNAPISHVAASDIGASAAAALIEPGHEGKTYVLTGPAPVTYEEDVVPVLTNLLGKEVRHQSVTDADAKQAMLDMGMPEWLVDGLVELFDIYRAGYAAEAHPGVREATGRDAQSYEQWATENRAAFSG